MTKWNIAISKQALALIADVKWIQNKPLIEYYVSFFELFEFSRRKRFHVTI